MKSVITMGTAVLVMLNPIFTQAKVKKETSHPHGIDVTNMNREVRPGADFLNTPRHVGTRNTRFRQTSRVTARSIFWQMKTTNVSAKSLRELPGHVVHPRLRQAKLRKK